MAGNQQDDPLAYGQYHPGNAQDDDGNYGATDRGIIGDTFQRFVGGQSSRPDGSQAGGQQFGGFVSSFFKKVHETIHDLGTEVEDRVAGSGVTHSHTHAGAQCTDGTHDSSEHRYGSFAAQRNGHDIKWFVDGCSYMWAVSRALEQATDSIWILDWWLSPELYLRRPPSRNEQYRIDRMLQAAAQRGVKVNIIVYKEVTQALTLSSSHTKHALEDLHPNISVFRHPDHLPDAQTLQSSFLSSLHNLSLNAATVSKLPQDALKAIYGFNEDVILYWAHHEKLCIVDGRIAFMGGLDLCYGRWDNNQHPIADAHPSNLDNIVFPGQDFNNARIMDFNDVAQWDQNKLDRRNSSRMGWSDISICLRGPAVEDLRAHFVERWNFIYDEKYNVRQDRRYTRLTFTENMAGTIPYNDGQGQQSDRPPYTGQGAQSTEQGPRPYYDNIPPGQSTAQGQVPYFPPPPGSGRAADASSGDQDADRGFDSFERPRRHHHHFQDEGSDLSGAAGAIRRRLSQGMQHVQDQYLSGNEHHSRLHGSFQEAGISCQIVRSCTKWSHGVPTEHSIADAYIQIIQSSQHFVYIENQFFITATSDKQKPVKNKIGAAIVERILRAARAGEKYKVIVMMPAIPAFAGDLKEESSLGTRAIMEFQYNSINRGGYSIMEMIAKEGFDPTLYIRFYNLRNYDRINVSASMKDAEQKSGVNYEDARREHDNVVDPVGYHARDGKGDGTQYNPQGVYQRYQQAAAGIDGREGLGTGRWDTVSECYMLGGKDIREVPWQVGNVVEIDAFVSEELYIHSKVLIADDRIVICGSANLNDRSQLGDHDSEIAIVVEDPTPVDSYMNGQPWRASKFAATLRRQLFRKHLGMLVPQNMEAPDQNFEPIGVPNIYDFGSAEDRAVADPLSDSFLNLWNARARQNTEAFGKIFHPVPHDSVRNWKDYGSFYEQFFHEAGAEAEGKEGKKKPAKYQWGHVVTENFSPGAQGAVEVKELLSTIRGTIVEMPLLFLIEEDIAKEGVTLNAFTEEVYT
ncbi:MAG: phospholipase D nuclease [Lasallia pustulata]|uniref:Phospholipase n=1 Tax=Lasallia pustulata TaxID=136370 RepID=A0A5M8PNQ7_9LECA|nr:MAG: phospholipase D nuclease [Lasallia pustulata]